MTISSWIEAMVIPPVELVCGPATACSRCGHRNVGPDGILGETCDPITALPARPGTVVSRPGRLGEVRRAGGAALEAHRRGDPEATALATNAYLRFEPLEKLLAESDASRIDPLEAGFVAFRTALANPATGDPDHWATGWAGPSRIS
jgi:hypothetical protein